MRIKEEEFMTGEIVLVKYRNIFGKVNTFVGFFWETVGIAKLFSDFGISICINNKNNEEIQKGFQVGFKIKRVIEIRKLK